MSDEKKPDPQLDPSRFHLAESVRETWAVTVEPGLTREQVTNPGFWSHIAAKLRPYARIEVRSDDGSFFADLLVLAAERTYARVHVLSWADLTTGDVAQTQDANAAAGYRVEWKGPHLKHCVIRASDAAIVHEKAQTKLDAQAWLTEHLRIAA